jgi:hypothetical protein
VFAVPRSIARSLEKKPKILSRIILLAPVCLALLVFA